MVVTLGHGLPRPTSAVSTKCSTNKGHAKISHKNHPLATSCLHPPMNQSGEGRGSLYIGTLMLCVLYRTLRRYISTVLLVHGQVTIIFILSVGLSVCFFVQSFSQPCPLEYRGCATPGDWVTPKELVFLGVLGLVDCTPGCEPHSIAASYYYYQCTERLMQKHPFNGLFSRTTWVSWHQKRKNHSGF